MLIRRRSLRIFVRPDLHASMQSVHKKMRMNGNIKRGADMENTETREEKREPVQDTIRQNAQKQEETQQTTDAEKQEKPER